MTGITYLALGSNLGGSWGTPAQTLARALQELRVAGCAISATSKTRKSLSLVPGQPPYYNLVVACRTNLPAGALLRVLKSIERHSGRRTRQRWSARTLDIDIVMAHCRQINWPHRRVGAVSLPHPEAHKRAFVLMPLCDISPHWRHPVLGKTAEELMNRLPANVRRTVRTV